MADKPGYAKLMYGKHSKTPRDYVTCHGKRVRRTVIVVRPLLVDRRFGRNKDVPRAYAFVSPVSCPDSPKRHRRGGKKKGKRTTTVSSAFGRYREKNPTLQRFGDIAPGAKLGMFKIFSNNSLVSSQQVNTTGAHNGSISAERCWDSVNTGPPYRSVGPFALSKSSVTGAGRTSLGLIKSFSSPSAWWQYEGDCVDDGDWISDTTGNYLPTFAPAITGYDTLAWDKLKPRVAQASLGQFIYELKDLPGQLKTSADGFLTFWRKLQSFRSNRPRSDLSAVMTPESAADHFLNHNFGWVPFLSDLSKLYDTHMRAHELISEISRTNGQWIRKRAVLKSEAIQRHIGRRYSAGIEPFGFNIQGMCNDMVVDGITCKAYFDITEVVETRVWATGLFTFYRPEFDMNLDYNEGYIGGIQRLMSLYGMRISPTLIYKVTPWTWLNDWFTGFGKYVERLDDFTVDGIVSKNLCIMAQTRRYVTKTSIVNFTSGRRTFQWRRELSSKVRKVADSPYGFDLSYNNLSVRQLAILSAIGITRSPTGFIARGA